MKRIFILFCGILVICATKDNKQAGFNIKATEKSFAYIPMGSFMFNDSSSEYNDEMTGKLKKTGKMVSVGSFYMCNHTVTNAEYLTFVNDLKNTNPALYNQMLPDTTVWRSKWFYNEPYVKYYFRHPAYSDYPLVGVTHNQAEYYCKWLTEKYMQNPKRKYKKANFRLPTVCEWEWAAAGGLALSPFPWGGPYMEGSDGKQKANFLYVHEQCIKKAKIYVKDSNGNMRETYGPVVSFPDPFYLGSAPTGNGAGDLTVPVISYQPNGYGLYNMAGNVRQYVLEKGFTKGGGWRDYGYYLQNWVEQPCDSTEKASNDIGFRVLMWVSE